MADEVDIANERAELIISTALEEHKNKSNRDREMREKMESAGIVIRCRYCEAELEGYSNYYCDSECRREDEQLKEALKRNGN